MAVPFVDLKAQYNSIRDEVGPAIQNILDNTQFVGGAPLAEFEAKFADYCETTTAVGVGNGTDALELVLQALGVGIGDEVITQGNSFMATASAIARTGARPVFVDIDPDTFTIDPALIEAAITDKTKVIIPVHLYGQPADMNAVNEIAKRRGIYVIEDAAQAHGAYYEGRRVGSLATAACFSFYPGKNLGAYGDGGAITSNDKELMERIAQLREHGRTTKYEHAVVGRNSRLDAMQAAILSVKLDHIDSWNDGRRQAAAWYSEQLAGTSFKTPTVRPGSTHVFHLYVIETDGREALAEGLAKADIATGIHYPVPLHQQPALIGQCTAHDLTEVERGAPKLLSLPMFPEITKEQVSLVTSTMLQLTGQERGLAAAE